MREDRCDIHCIHHDQVQMVMESLPPAHDITVLADLCKTLGDGTRLKICLSLAERDLCVCDLAAITGASESAVSHQLRILRHKGWVAYLKKGKICYYHWKFENPVAGWLAVLAGKMQWGNGGHGK